MSVKARNAVALACNVAVFVLTAYSVATFFTVGGEGNMQVMGTYCFRFFTIDSNILAALAGAALIPREVRALRTGHDEIPHWALVLKYAGTLAVTVTFVVVVAFLGLIYGYGEMFAGTNLFLHGTNPVLCMLSFLLLEYGVIHPKEIRWAELPVAVYGLVYLVMVLILGPERGGWPDFYFFTMGGLWYVFFTVILGGAFGLAALERLPHRAGKGRASAKE